MDYSLIAWTFAAFLATSIIVFIGLTSLVTHIESASGNQFYLQHKTLSLIAIELAFYVLFYVNSWTIYAAHTFPFNFNWMYLPAQMLVAFIFAIAVHSRWQLLVSLVFPVVWSHFAFATHPYVIQATIVVMGALVFCNLKWNLFIDRVWLTYVVYAVLLGSYLVINQMRVDVEATRVDLLRQVVTGVVLILVTHVYANSLIRSNKRAEQFEREALVDELTQLGNFRAFTSELVQNYDHFLETGEQYALFAIDVDHFKKINDEYGHLNGNQVLRSVADTVARRCATAKYDSIAYRTGGEEFTVIMRYITEDPDYVVQFSREIRADMHQLRFDFTTDVFPITVSIGEDRIMQSDVSYLDLFRRADKYLYLSKENGRNALTFRGETVTLE